jgi:hypothetical protein
MLRKQQLNHVLELSASQLEALRSAVDLALDQPAPDFEGHEELKAIKETFSAVAPPRVRYRRRA